MNSFLRLMGYTTINPRNMVKSETVFRLYLAVKVHFSCEKYDVVKQNARVNNSTWEDLEKRNDAKIISSFAKHFNTTQECASFMVANLAHGNVYPFGDEEKSFDILKNWQRKRQSLTKIFKDDIATLDDLNLTYQELIDSAYDVPKLFVLLKNRKISLESICVFEQLNPFVDKWRKDQPLWKNDFLRIKKLSSFVKPNDKMVALFANQFNVKETNV